VFYDSPVNEKKFREKLLHRSTTNMPDNGKRYLPHSSLTVLTSIRYQKFIRTVNGNESAKKHVALYTGYFTSIGHNFGSCFLRSPNFFKKNLKPTRDGS
jgi:hypothetical protein